MHVSVSIAQILASLIWKAQFNDFIEFDLISWMS